MTPDLLPGEPRPFAFKATFLEPEGSASSGCLLVLAGDIDAAFDAGRAFTDDMLSDAPEVGVGRVWLEIMVPFIVGAEGMREELDWARPPASDAPGVFFCCGETLAGKQPYHRDAVSHTAVNGLVRAADFDEAEALWQAFLDAEYPGLTCSALTADLPPFTRA